MLSNKLPMEQGTSWYCTLYNSSARTGKCFAKIFVVFNQNLTGCGWFTYLIAKRADRAPTKKTSITQVHALLIIYLFAVSQSVQFLRIYVARVPPSNHTEKDFVTPISLNGLMTLDWLWGPQFCIWRVAQLVPITEWISGITFVIASSVRMMLDHEIWG